MDTSAIEQRLAEVTEFELAQALAAARTPKEARDDDDHAVLRHFEERYLQFGDADPSAIAAILSNAPEGVFEVHWRLQGDRPNQGVAEASASARGSSPESGAYAMIMEGEASAPQRPRLVAEAMDDEEAPTQRRKRKKRVYNEDEAEPEAQEPQEAGAGRVRPNAEPNPDAQAAEIIGMTSDRASDEQIGQFLDKRESGARTNWWVRRAAQGVLATTVIGTAGLATHFVGGLKKAAEDKGNEVQKKQQVIGEDADNLVDPFAPINSLKGQGGDTQTKDTQQGAEKLINKQKGKGRQ